MINATSATNDTMSLSSSSPCEQMQRFLVEEGDHQNRIVCTKTNVMICDDDIVIDDCHVSLQIGFYDIWPNYYS